MHRNPFSTIAPLVPDGDYLISAQAMEYTAEYHRIAARAAEFQLISRDDPGLCAAAMDPKAPIGAAMPDLSHQMRRLLLRLRKHSLIRICCARLSLPHNVVNSQKWSQRTRSEVPVSPIFIST